MFDDAVVVSLLAVPSSLEPQATAERHKVTVIAIDRVEKFTFLLPLRISPVNAQQKPETLFGRELIVGKAISQSLLRELAHTGFRNFINKHHIVGNLPLSYFRGQKLQDGLLGQLCARL